MRYKGQSLRWLMLKLLWCGAKWAWVGLFPARPLKRFEWPSEDDIQDFYDSWEWDRLSYKTRKAAGWKCMACNATRKEGAKIVCDHIKPIRRYWHLRWDRDNLQVLCNRCNRGKGSWDETDFRARPFVTHYG